MENSDSVDFLLVQVCRLHYQRAHELLETINLYRGQPPVLHLLYQQEGMTQTELAERMQVTPATINKMLQRMEKNGFVERRPDPEDQRRSRVYLTEAGRAVQGQVRAIFRKIEVETFSGFSGEELSQLRAYLERIRNNLAQSSSVSSALQSE